MVWVTMTALTVFKTVSPTVPPWTTAYVRSIEERGWVFCPHFVGEDLSVVFVLGQGPTFATVRVL